MLSHLLPVCAGAPLHLLWGPGARAPTLLISPFAKRQLVEQKVKNAPAILKLIETRYGLTPLASCDAPSPDMTEALDLQQ